MGLLIGGLVLWVVAHVFKRVAPDARASLTDRLGTASKGVFAAVLLLSVVLIVMGYRAAPFIPVYTPPAWGVHLVDLLMFPAIALFGLGSSKSSLRRHMRHPQLWGFTLWSALHLLVNGDLASVIMWGTFIVWALAEMRLINMREPYWQPYEGGSTKGTIRLAVITAVLYVIITAIHYWLGVNPFGA
ncbi:NnrU protein [Palleronia salina]|uniref:NnrU protein n=1 Tax=Palleronia salina TaxID=313368 RepID=A0A1M6FSE4_9RHOB|nr:NnrU family protein [Palleronia salina]SHJ00614.1 NnrU protein [Palleronia salina]